jgi:hypothetical protein
LNAFGDPRTPSANELFMRLNGRLSSMGFPIVLNPTLPRTTPNTGVMELNFPTLWQLNPNVATLSCDPYDTGNGVITQNLNNLVGFQFSNDYYMCWRMKIQDKQFQPTPTNEIFEIFKFVQASQYGFKVRLHNANTNIVTIKLIYTSSGGETTYSYDVPRSVIYDNFHFGVFNDSGSFSQLKFTIHPLSILVPLLT